MSKDFLKSVMSRELSLNIINKTSSDGRQVFLRKLTNSEVIKQQGLLREMIEGVSTDMEKGLAYQKLRLAFTVCDEDGNFILADINVINHFIDQLTNEELGELMDFVNEVNPLPDLDAKKK